MSAVWLVRHAQASYLEADYDRLSDLGQRQAERLAAHWIERGVRFDRAFAGPRRRQHHTGEIVARTYRDRGLPFPELELLGELDEYRSDELLGTLLAHVTPSDPELEQRVAAFSAATEKRDRGRALDRVLQHLMRAWARGAGAHLEIESWAAFTERLDHALRVLTDGGRSGRHVVAFSSGGAIGAMVGRVVHAAADGALELGWTVNNTGVTELLFGGTRINLSRYNVIDHLGDPTFVTYR